MKTPREKQKGLLEQLGQQTPFLAASLNHVKRMDKQGRKQDYHILTFKKDGKTRSVYVPKDMLKEVKLWIQHYQKIKKLMADISTLSISIIRTHVSEKRDDDAKSLKKKSSR